MQKKGSKNKEVKSTSQVNSINKFFSKGAFILFIIALLYIVIQFVAYHISGDNKKNDEGPVAQSGVDINSSKEIENKDIDTEKVTTDSDKDNIDKAVEIVSGLSDVKEYIKNTNDAQIEFDHIENVNGYKFYVIHIYNVTNDHAVTFNWYYVDTALGLVVDNNGYIIQGNVKGFGEKDNEDLAVECVKSIYNVNKALKEDGKAEVKFDHIDDNGNYVVTLNQDTKVATYVVDFDNKTITDESNSRYNLLGTAIIE